MSSGSRLLPLHRQLLVAMLLLTMGASGAWYLFIYPLEQSVKTERARNSTTREELRVYGYPLDPARLTPLNKQLTDDKFALYRRLSDVYDVAVAHFQRRMEPYGTIDGLRKSITFLDFSERLDALRQKMQSVGMALDEDTLGLSSDSSVFDTYRLVVHLWVVEDLVDLVHKHKLDPRADNAVTRVNPETRESYSMTPSRFTVLPMRAYGIGPENKTPFVEEFPVRFTVRGRVQDVANLLADLTRDGRFMPLERCLVSKHGVEEIRAGNRRYEVVEATIVVSAFLILREKHDIQSPGGTEDKSTNIPPWRPGH